MNLSRESQFSTPRKGNLFICTVIFKSSLGIVSKNRDKTIPTSEEIIVGDNFLAIGTVGSDYFSCGVDNHGCAFASAAINTPKWTQAASTSDTKLAEKILKLENEGLTSPTKLVSNMLPYVRSVDEWLEAINNAPNHWLGYNIMLIDKEQAFRIELYKAEKIKSPIEKQGAFTNHFERICYGPATHKDYPSSFDRLELCNQKLNEINNIQNLKHFITNNTQTRHDPLWRSGFFFTVSASILDIINCRILYSSENNGIFQNYKLQNLS